MTNHVITGATGFLGSHLLASLAKDPSTTHVYALARDSAARTAAERVKAAVEHAGHDAQSGDLEPIVVQSELTSPLCGVDGAAFGARLQPLVFWHLAASLRWKRGERKAVFQSNVDGTRNALDLAATLDADLFVYVSTAYTCGKLAGDLPEELHHPPSFNNIYEESKCVAEHLVQRSEGTRTLILRPSVVLGTSHDFKPSGSYTGLYGYLSELRRFKATLGDTTDRVRFAGDRAARISFIPVDHAVQDMTNVVAAELAAPGQGIYHITGETISSVGEIADYLFKLLELYGVLEITPGPIAGPTPLERFFAKRVEFFSHYVRDERRFVRSLMPVRATAIDEVRKYIDAENTLFGVA